MNFNITEDDRKVYKILFDEADKDGDGFLSGPELGCVLNSMGEKISQKQIELIIKLVDKDSDGELDFDEFMDLVEGNIGDFEDENEIRRLFKAFDRKNTGFITRRDLREVMETIDEKITEEQIDQLIKDSDTNLDGKISVEGT